MTLSNTQITKLGERLRDSDLSEDDLAVLDAFRQTYSEVDERAYQIIRDAIASLTDLTVTKRKRKTQQSIVDKLRRQPNLRLPQMQDIAGCRIVVQGGIQHAQSIDALLAGAFGQRQWEIESKDRHADGYRALHIIARSNNMADRKFYEIQLRTYAQDVWANLVERLSDEKNTLKYGGSEQEQEQDLMKKLKNLAEHFLKIDQSADQVTFNRYQQQIEEAIRHVLSH
jgi:GTP pyrophosphokinase